MSPSLSSAVGKWPLSQPSGAVFFRWELISAAGATAEFLPDKRWMAVSPEFDGSPQWNITADGKDLS